MRTGPEILSPSGDRVSKVLDIYIYRLLDEKTPDGTRVANSMGHVARNMRHAVAEYPNFSGKEVLEVRTWLRKFLKTWNDNEISEEMALYVIPQFLSGDVELRSLRALPDSTSAS